MSLIILLIIILLIEVYLVAFKRNVLHPAFWFLAVWTLCILFTEVDYYHILVKISDKAILAVWLGIAGYIVGAFLPVRIVVSKSKSHYVSDFTYRKIFVYIALYSSFVVNVILIALTLLLLRNGTEYGTIRELYFANGSGYSASGNGFFSSKVLALFNSLISTPFTYVTSIVLADNLFSKRLSVFFDIIAAIDVILYIVATGGRLLILVIIVTTFVLMKYYQFSIPQKVLKNIWKIILAIVIVLIAVTIQRRTADYYKYEKVNDAYAYFNITIPLLSNWIDKIDTMHLHTNGIGFFNGIIQLFDTFIFKRVGISNSLIDQFADLLGMVQNNKIQVYHLHWYNAYVSLFLYFYADFRYFGVFIGSFIFGFASKEIYSRVVKCKQQEYLLLYVLIIQASFISFIRWHFGISTTIVQLIMLMLVVKPIRSYE